MDRGFLYAATFLRSLATGTVGILIGIFGIVAAGRQRSIR